MIYDAPTKIIILCYVIIISVAVALVALFSLSDSLLTIRLHLTNFLTIDFLNLRPIDDCGLTPNMLLILYIFKTRCI